MSDKRMAVSEQEKGGGRIRQTDRRSAEYNNRMATAPYFYGSILL
jgi:hypothetical protein